jgi:hypothetical protein
MRGRSRRDTKKEYFWRKAIARFATSGLTKTQFCKREGLSVDLLRYWTDAIAERDGQHIEASSAGTNGATFLPLNVAEHGQQDRWPGTQQMVVAELVVTGCGTVFVFNGITKETVRALWLGTMERIE